MVNEPGAVPGSASGASAGAAPQIRVVAGHPSDEEAAAVAVALAARIAASAGSVPPRRRALDWSDRSRLLRLPPRPGPGAWRRSALPR